MKLRALAIATGAAVLASAVVLGVAEILPVSTVSAGNTVPVVQAATPSTTVPHGHRHRHRLPGFAGSFETWRPSSRTVITWSWARGTLDALSGTSIAVTEPNGQVVTVPLSPTVRFRGTSQAVAAHEHGVRVLVVERNGEAIRVILPHGQPT
jgi:hypothetical protein